jgi:hypothetical protein
MKKRLRDISCLDPCYVCIFIQTIADIMNDKILLYSLSSVVDVIDRPPRIAVPKFLFGPLKS